ncbi:hypothetical protein D3C71_1640080 [compost metagenome]
MVATLRPTTWAMRRMGMRLRRRRSMRCVNSMSTVVRVRAGLEVRSIKPSGPNITKRFRHLQAVR